MDKYKISAKKIRKNILNMVYKAKVPHIGSSFSIVEILTALYFSCLKISPRVSQYKSRDRFILSKGHGCPALYAVLSHRGFLDQDAIRSFCSDGGSLEGHPNRDTKNGIEVSTGSLGHGLSIGVGMAIAEKYDISNNRIFVLMSDGESQSGFVWEAAMFAAQHKLDNLIAIIDYNKIQALGRVKEVIDLEPYKDKWAAFGWGVKEIDGHDFKEIFSALGSLPFIKEKPSVIIAHTVKGKGVSFMEDDLLWHYRCPDDKEYKKALKELR